jgi:hypothetical protein
MKNRSILLIALFVTVAFVSVSVPDDKDGNQETCSGTALNELGANGWELVPGNEPPAVQSHEFDIFSRSWEKLMKSE